MQAYYCTVCGYVYDDETADKNAEGNPIPFEDLDEEWACPVCDTKPELFQRIDSDRTPDVPVK
jgi:rubredoxin